jgi:enoyl-[acyl-carrier protein] reductase III
MTAEAGDNDGGMVMTNDSTGLRTDLQGRIALVTGSSRGLGRETAIRLASLGAVPIVTYHRQAEEAESVSKEITAAGGRCHVRQLDMGEPTSIGALFDWIEGPNGPGGVDILIANAAATAFKPLLAIKPHHVDKTFAITITGFLAAVQRAVPQMQERGGGRIVAVSGIDTRTYGPAHGLLAAAKAGMEMLVRYLEIELSGTGVRVIGVNPSTFHSAGPKLLFGPLYDRVMNALAWAHPRKVIDEPGPVAEAIALCCTDATELFAGRTVDLDGGSIFAMTGKFTEFAVRAPEGSIEAVTESDD